MNIHGSPNTVFSVYPSRRNPIITIIQNPSKRRRRSPNLSKPNLRSLNRNSNPYLVIIFVYFVSVSRNKPPTQDPAIFRPLWMLFFAWRMLNRETPVSRFSRRSPTVFRSLKSFRETSSSPSVSQRMPFFREHPLKSSSRKVPVDFYRERERERECVVRSCYRSAIFSSFFFLYLIRLLSRLKFERIRFLQLWIALKTWSLVGEFKLSFASLSSKGIIWSLR